MASQSLPVWCLSWSSDKTQRIEIFWTQEHWMTEVSLTHVFHSVSLWMCHHISSSTWSLSSVQQYWRSSFHCSGMGLTCKGQLVLESKFVSVCLSWGHKMCKERALFNLLWSLVRAESKNNRFCSQLETTCHIQSAWFLWTGHIAAQIHWGFHKRGSQGTWALIVIHHSDIHFGDVQVCRFAITSSPISLP